MKTWLQSNDVKDKTNLMKARKDVERNMERFKVCEKETKTKQFSKQGLAAAEEASPEEVAQCCGRFAEVGACGSSGFTCDVDLRSRQQEGRAEAGLAPG